MSKEQSVFYALLIGIDQWVNEKVPPLKGCVADIGLMTDLLTDTFGLPTDNICVLTGTTATRAGIEQAFRKHLIERARDMSPAERENAVFLFHYSGHGSRAINSSGTTATGFDETIVPQDSRTNGVFDIKDWELGGWIDELTEYSSNVTIILDCCHSGSGTRDVGDGLTNELPGRQCLPDLRSQPIQTGTRSAPKTHSRKSASKVGEATDLEKSNRYTLIASCRADEIANELPGEETGASHVHGVMTYYLSQELAHLPARQLTYRELNERLRHRVNARFPRQMPQCEGDRDRVIFGGTRPNRSSLRAVVDIRDGYHWIDSGQAHGIAVGTVLDVYPPDTRSLSADSKMIGQLVVEEVGAVRSACSVQESSSPIELASRVAVRSVPKIVAPRSVQLDCDDAGVRADLSNRFSSPDSADLLKINDNEQSVSGFDIVLRQAGEELLVEDGAGRLIPSRYGVDQLDKLAQDLIQRARFQNALEICNTAPDSNLAGALEIRLQGLGFDAETQEPIAVLLSRGGIERGGTETSGSETVVEVGDRIVIQLTNHSDQPLYVYLFNFSHDGSIAQIYPRARGAQEVLAPGRTVSIGMSKRKAEQIWVQPQSVSEAAEQLKAFGTIDETSFEVLEQGPLATTRLANESALGKLLASAAGGCRGLGAPPNSAEDDWTSAELDFRIVQSASTATHRISDAAITRIAQYDLEVTAPPGFSGELSVMTSRQGERSATEEFGACGPPVLEASEMFAAYALPAAVRAAPDAGCIAITADDPARESVTNETPMRLALPRTRSDVGENLLVIAHDGERYYPVGQSAEQDHEIAIEWLPPQTAASDSGEFSSAGTRGIGRTLRLYVYKLLNVTSPDLGLRRARFVAAQDEDRKLEGNELLFPLATGTLKTRPFQKSDLNPGQRIVLFIHGFQSDTRWLVEGTGQYLQEQGVEYDHCLTFDYESYGTSINENAKTLAAQLDSAGFGSDDQVHLDIVSHDMGGLLARAMIELHGGATFVDRCLLVGVPNQGTLLAESLRLVPWLGTVIVNATATLPLAALAGIALKKFMGDAKGLTDMRPTSDFIKLLGNEAESGDEGEDRVAYRLIAGNYPFAPTDRSGWQAVAERMLKISQSGLSLFFGDNHDLVVNTQSMLQIRGGQYPSELIRSAIVPSDHFSYFSDAQTRELIVKWLSEPLTPRSVAAGEDGEESAGE